MIILVGLLLSLVLLLLLFIVIGFFFFLFDLFLELPYLGTRRKKIETIMQLAQLRKGETAVDLGSGDGRLLLAGAKREAFAIGYEINPLLILITLIHAKLRGFSDRVSVYKESLWNADLAVADVVFVFAKRKTMERFEKFVFENCRKGTRVVVNMNPFPNKKPLNSKDGIFLYKV